MISIIISMIVFASAVAIKGGWLGTIFTNWNRLVKRVEATFSDTVSQLKSAWSKIAQSPTELSAYVGLFKPAFVLPFQGFAKWFLDGSVISLFLVVVYVAATQPSLTVAALFGLSWMLIWSSMGEEAGAAGDYKGAWGEYIEARNPDGQLAFTRSYGIKKGIQYGCFFGAGLSMAVGSWTLWIAAATFPICYFLGSSLHRWLKGERSWTYAEPLYGSVIGLAYGLAMKGYLPILSVFTN